MTAARQPPAHDPSAAAMDIALDWMRDSGRGEPYERRLAGMFDAFAARAVAAERERCAKIAERWKSPRLGITVARNPGLVVDEIITAIRSGGWS